MSRLHHSDYNALDLNGENYLDGAMNTSADLKSKGLEKCIKYGNDTLSCERHRAIMIMRKHLVEDLKDECSYINDPYDLWSRLNTMFYEPLLDESMKEWKALRIQDYEFVDDYHSDLMRITYSLRLYGGVITNDDLLNKTRDTFHSKEVLLSHKAKGFTTYYDLLSYLLANEQKKQKRKDNLNKLDEIMIHAENLACEMIYGNSEEAKKRKIGWTHIDDEISLYIE